MCPNKKDLLLKNGNIVSYMKIKSKDFLNKSILIYGRTGSGKSTILEDIIFNLKDIIPSIVVITSTNIDAYSNIIPKQCIHKEVDQNLISKIVERQEAAVEHYKKLNNLDILLPIFLKYSTQNERNDLKQYDIILNQCQNKYMNNNDITYEQKMIKINTMKNINKKKKIEYIKKTLIRNKNNHSYNLSQDEKSVLKYCTFNPHMLLILDDCAHSIKSWGKFPEMADLFFNGRHKYITTIIALQNDKLLPSALRENARINIFTTQESAIGFFTNKTNNFSKTEIKNSEEASNVIFNNNEGLYNKMIYFTEKDPHIYYINVDLHFNFRFGDENLWSLCEYIQLKKNNHSNNRFSIAFN
jgi:hypothetical protein